MRIWPGDPAPLGSTFDGIGANEFVYYAVEQAHRERTSSSGGLGARSDTDVA